MIRSLAQLLPAALTCFTLASLASIPAGAQEQETPRFIMVTHGADSDPFWATVKQGAEQAAKDAGVTIEYRAPETFDLEAMSALVSAAAAETPAGLVVTIPNADALAAPIRAAADAGIPIVSINSGFDIAQSLGAMLHVGQGEYEAGRVAGESMRDLGGVKALCINHELGNIALDLRCKGFIDGFGGSVEVLPVESDAESAGTAIAEKLEADAEIDVVLALSASIAGEPAVEAVRALGDGRNVHVGSFDITDAILTAVADRAASFAIDQQPFLQGYLPVQVLALYRRHGVAPVSNVSTGPRLVTAEEAGRRLGRAALQAGEGAEDAAVPVDPVEPEDG